MENNLLLYNKLSIYSIEYLLLLFTELHLGQIKPAQTYKYKINC